MLAAVLLLVSIFQINKWKGHVDDWQALGIFLNDVKMLLNVITMNSTSIFKILDALY